MPVTHWVDRFFENVSADSCVSGTRFLQHGGDMKSKGFLLTRGLAAEPQLISDLSTKPLQEAGCARVRALPRHCSPFGAGRVWPWAAGTQWVWSIIPGFHLRMQEHPLHV